MKAPTPDELKFLRSGHWLGFYSKLHFYSPVEIGLLVKRPRSGGHWIWLDLSQKLISYCDR
jgi:hypothetical protein